MLLPNFTGKRVLHRVWLVLVVGTLTAELLVINKSFGVLPVEVETWTRGRMLEDTATGSCLIAVGPDDVTCCTKVIGTDPDLDTGPKVPVFPSAGVKRKVVIGVESLAGAIGKVFAISDDLFVAFAKF